MWKKAGGAQGEVHHDASYHVPSKPGVSDQMLYFTHRQFCLIQRNVARGPGAVARFPVHSGVLAFWRCGTLDSPEPPMLAGCGRWEPGHA